MADIVSNERKRYLLFLLFINLRDIGIIVVSAELTQLTVL